MKKVKGLVLFLLTVCVLTVMPAVLKMDVQAESTTYCIGGKNNEGKYCFQKGYPWDASAEHKDIIYLQYNIKEGDKVVIYPEASGVELEIGVRIADLTFTPGTSAVAYLQNSCDAVYVLGGASAAINGDIVRGEVYGGAAANFNNNVETGIVHDDAKVYFGGNVNRLEILAEKKLKAYVQVAGTVNTLVVQGGEHVDYVVQNIHEGKMKMEKGELQTSSKYFNAKLTGEEAATMSEFTKTQQAAAQSAPAAGNNASSSDYDAVPKTGDTTNAFAWFIMAAAFAGVAVFARKRSEA